MFEYSRVSRRQLLLSLGKAAGILAASGVLAACGGAAAPSLPPAAGGRAASQALSPKPPSSAAAASSGDSQTQLEKLVGPAKQEGRVAVMTQAGDSVRSVFEAFQTKFGVTVEQQTGAGSPDLVPRVTNERKASQYNWDVVVHGSPAIFAGFKPAGALEPLKSALVLPEVLDDRSWIAGFDAGWADVDKAFDFVFVSYLFWCSYINRKVVPEQSLNKFEQLWDPQWKGKIAVLDPRLPSAGAGSVAAMLAATNEDKLRAFLRDQQPVVTQDRRQLAEWVIRGQYPIALGQDVTIMQDFISQGLDVQQVKPLVDDALGASLLSSSFGTMGLFNRAPHPNAAKLLINWLLSREGQTVWTQKTGLNSRRSDVPPVTPPEQIADPKKTYLNLQIEQTYPTYLRAVAIAKEVIK